MRDMLSGGKISRSEYLEWKLKWSADKEEYNMNSDDYFTREKLREMYARELQVSTGLRATLENIIPADRKIIIDITTSGENPNCSQIQKISMIDTDGNLLYDNIYSAQEIAKINEILLSAKTIIGYDLGKVIAFLRAAYCVWRSDYEFISLKNNYRYIDLSVRTELDFKSFTSYFGYDDNTDDTVDRCRAMLLVFISSLFFWLDKPDDKKQQKEKELLEDYVVYIGDYFDRQQISILQKVDRFWGGFKPDKYNYQNNSPAYIECLDNYDNRWLKLENFTYENVIALAAVKKFHELETKTSFSDGEEIDIKTYVMSITEQDLDDVMTGLFNVVIELQVGPCNGDCTETETVTATEIKTFQGYDKYNNPIYYLKGYNIEHKFSYIKNGEHLLPKKKRK